MTGNEFRRIALAQGLLPVRPPRELGELAPPAVETVEPPCPQDTPAIAERHELDA